MSNSEISHNCNVDFFFKITIPFKLRYVGFLNIICDVMVKRFWLHREVSK